MSERSYWSWTTVIEIDGKERTIPGHGDGPAHATEDTLLPHVVNALKKELGAFTLVRFSATRTG